LYLRHGCHRSRKTYLLRTDQNHLQPTGKIGLVQILPTSRDVNSHTAAILREKSVTLAYFVGYRTRNKKQSPGIAIQTRPPALPGSRFRKACLMREKWEHFHWQWWLSH
jgi:hypothetical protein